MAVTCNPQIQGKVVKTYTPDGASEQSVAFTQYDRTGPIYNSESTYTVDTCAEDELTPGNGTSTLDLTAAADVVGGTSITFNGKKIRWAKFQAPSTNSAVVKVKTGASNGYDLQGGQQIWVYPGCTVGIELRNGLSAVDGTHKTLDITGTVAGDKLRYELVGG